MVFHVQATNYCTKGNITSSNNHIAIPIFHFTQVSAYLLRMFILLPETLNMKSQRAAQIRHFPLQFSTIIHNGLFYSVAKIFLVPNNFVTIIFGYLLGFFINLLSPMWDLFPNGIPTQYSINTTPTTFIFLTFPYASLLTPNMPSILSEGKLTSLCSHVGGTLKELLYAIYDEIFTCVAVRACTWYCVCTLVQALHN